MLLPDRQQVEGVTVMMVVCDGVVVLMGRVLTISEEYLKIEN